MHSVWYISVKLDLGNVSRFEYCLLADQLWSLVLYLFWFSRVSPRATTDRGARRSRPAGRTKDPSPVSGLADGLGGVAMACGVAEAAGSPGRARRRGSVHRDPRARWRATVPSCELALAAARLFTLRLYRRRCHCTPVPRSRQCMAADAWSGGGAANSLSRRNGVRALPAASAAAELLWHRHTRPTGAPDARASGNRDQPGAGDRL